MKPALGAREGVIACMVRDRFSTDNLLEIRPLHASDALAKRHLPELALKKVCLYIENSASLHARHLAGR